MSATDVNSVFNASAQVMSPFSTTPLAIVLSEIQTDASSNAKVAWSCSFNGATALTVGASVTMPTGLASPSSYYILVQTSYQYTPTVGASFVGAFPMTDQIYMIPRSSPSIPNSGC
jgi:Flp pilus assembly protein TadG